MRPRKRISSEPDAAVKSDTSAKRKPSPIRFEASEKEAVKREAATIYSPPKDKFSKKFANGSNFDDYVARRGGRGKRGRMRAKASWRV